MFTDYLEQEGFRVACAHDGQTGARAALSGQHAIVILDVMMPGMNGIMTLRRIRAASRMPVLMLTGRGGDADRILGLELGADDYVTKPCTPREITARVRADQDLGDIFEPFFRVNPTGNNVDSHGLGLAIAKRVVGNHGGRITAANRPGGGLRATLSLPRAQQAD